VNQDRTQPSRAEDHPKQHPWEYIAESLGGHSIGWCPLCGAICWDYDDDGGRYTPEMRLPDIAKETR
jgi:hypothetical protein